MIRPIYIQPLVSKHLSPNQPLMKRQKPTMPLTTIKPPPTPPQPPLKTPNTTSKNWVPLNLTKTELNLPLTFPTGQTFRWKQTKTTPLTFTGPIGPHLISLQHQNDDVYFQIHRTPSLPKAKTALFDFLNLDISLTDMWDDFSASDSRFAELARCFRGARVLRQDPLECLIQFLCSSNNNITRITKMVDFVSSLGDWIGVVEGFEFYEFPSLERLATVSEEQFREAGFGYRLGFDL